MSSLCLFLVIACLFDYRRRKIPNVLIVVMFVYGWGRGLFLQGYQEVLRLVIESVIVMCLLYPMFKIGAMGAGDVKLYGACVGYLPHEKFLFFFFLSLLIAAVVSLIKMIKERNVRERILYFCDYLLNVVQSGKVYLYIQNENESKRTSICLAGPILGSVLLQMGGIY